jgi:hypothetical protein
MIRFIKHLLGLTYEECKGCEVLRQQLAIANDEKQRLTSTLLDIIKPKVYESAPVELEPVVPKYTTFTRRRAALEEAARDKARVMKESQFVAAKDTDALEKELDINKAV